MNKRTVTQSIFMHFTSRLSFRMQLVIIFGLVLITQTGGIILVISKGINSSNQHQADSIGQLLCEQTAIAVSDMLVTGDRLSLNILLGQLVQTPYVVEASIHSIDNQKIAKAVSKIAVDDAEYPVYSFPIHYNDVIAGYASISLNKKLLNKKATETLSVIVVISVLLLILGSILLQFYVSSVVLQLELLERQLISILPQSKPLFQKKGEISRLSSMVEQQLLHNRISDIDEDIEKNKDATIIVAIKVKRQSRLQRLLSARDLRDILRMHNNIINEAVGYYGGEVTYSPEGNAYLRFSYKDSSTFLSDALLCCLMIEDLTKKAGEINITRVHISIGISLCDSLTEFPKEEHPALAESAASRALALAGMPDVEGIYIRKLESAWLSPEFADFEDVDDSIVKINGVKHEYSNKLREHISAVESVLS